METASGSVNCRMRMNPNWLKKASAYSGAATKGTVATSTYVATLNGATTTIVEDSKGGHGEPGSRARREGNAPIVSFSRAERVREFFQDKQRLPNSPRPADTDINP